MIGISIALSLGYNRTGALSGPPPAPSLLFLEDDFYFQFEDGDFLTL
jgi:hypothetical protein